MWMYELELYHEDDKWQESQAKAAKKRIWLWELRLDIRFSGIVEFAHESTVTFPKTDSIRLMGVPWIP